MDNTKTPLPKKTAKAVPLTLRMETEAADSFGRNWKEMRDQFSKNSDKNAVSRLFVEKSSTLFKEVVEEYAASTNLKTSDFFTVEVKELKSSESALDKAKGLIEVNQYEVQLTRLSSVLSMNKSKEAIAYIKAISEVLENLEYGDVVYLKTMDGKSKVETEFFRNLYGLAIKHLFLKSMDRGVLIYYLERGQRRFLDMKLLDELYAQGIAISIEERTRVYNGLFAGGVYAQFKSHFVQFLQWHFGLNRSMPQIVYNEIKAQFGDIGFSAENSAELEYIRERAKELLKEKAEIFGLSSLSVANRRIDEFMDLVKENAEITNPVKRCDRIVHATIKKYKIPKCEDCNTEFLYSESGKCIETIEPNAETEIGEEETISLFIDDLDTFEE